jgi:hypothetical protein
MRRMTFAPALILLAVAACGLPSTTPSPGLSQPSATASSTEATEGLLLVAIGDSIPFNCPDDCPGCTGFVDRYADAVAAATGKPVEVRNLSQHNNQTLPGMLADLDRLAGDLAQAAILPDWSEVDEECAVDSAERHRPEYDLLFSQIVALREGKPSLFRTINRYNDWIGWEQVADIPEVPQKTKMVIDVWNTMLCAVAEANGFGCADLCVAFNGPDGLHPSGDLLAGDYTHPSDLGRGDRRSPGRDGIRAARVKQESAPVHRMAGGARGCGADEHLPLMEPYGSCLIRLFLVPGESS